MAGEKSPLTSKALPTGTFVYRPPNSRLDFPEGLWVLLAESAPGKTFRWKLVCSEEEKKCFQGPRLQFWLPGLCLPFVLTMPSMMGCFRGSQVGSSKESSAGGGGAWRGTSVCDSSPTPQNFLFSSYLIFPPRKPCDFICFSLHVLN